MPRMKLEGNQRLVETKLTNLPSMTSTFETLLREMSVNWVIAKDDLYLSNRYSEIARPELFIFI